MKIRRELRAPRAGEVASFISRKANWAKSYGEEIRFRKSPCCGDDDPSNPSAQINQKSGLWRCFRCGRAGNFFHLASLFGDEISDRYLDGSIPRPIDPRIIEKFIGERRRPVSGGHYPELLEYARNRGITEKTLDAFRVSSKGPKAFRFPIYDVVDGRLAMVNAKIKTIDPEAKAKDWFDVRGGRTDILIGIHLLDVDGPKRAIIFEGQFDAMTAYEMGMRNVFSLPSGASNVDVEAMLRWIPDDFEIIVASDMDEAGDRCAERFFAALPADKIRRAKLPHKDLNDWYREDPFISEADFMAVVSENFFLKKSRPSFEPESRSTTDRTCFTETKIEADLMTIDFMSERKNGDRDEIIATTPFEVLDDEISGGFRAGQTTSVLGHSGGGKSSFINQIVIHAAGRQKVKAGLVSVEGTRNSVVSKMIESAQGLLSREELAEASKNFLISPLMGYDVGENALVRDIERMADEGCKIIAIDNLDFICANDFDKKARLHKRIIKIAVDRSIHIVFVWQPHKVDRQKIITSGDQKGLSTCLQDSENYIVINRVGGEIKITIEKTREEGEKLGSIWLEWSKEKRIFEVSAKTFEAKNCLPKTIFGGRIIDVFETRRLLALERERQAKEETKMKIEMETETKSKESETHAF